MYNHTQNFYKFTMSTMLLDYKNIDGEGVHLRDIVSNTYYWGCIKNCPYRIIVDS